MYIAQIMHDTVREYEAVFTHFSQNETQREQNPEGVCHALCKLWLRSGKLPCDFKIYCSGKIKSIDRKQSSYVKKLHERGELKGKYLDIGKENIISLVLCTINNKTADDFWEEAAEQMTTIDPFAII